MNTKRKVTPKVDHRLYEFQIPGKKTLLTPGTEVSLRGKTGRFRFQYAAVCEFGVHATVLTFVGGPLSGSREQYVSAYPERVTRIHRINKTLINIQKEKTNG